MSSTATKKDIGALAASLRRIHPRFVQRDPSGQTQKIWFQGGEPYFDVVFEIVEGRVGWFQLALRGRVVTWSAATGAVSTGKTNDLGPDTATTYPGSKTVRDDETPNRAFVQFARAILAARPEEPLFVELAGRLGGGLAPRSPIA
jgi:hypothetical protein